MLSTWHERTHWSWQNKINVACLGNYELWNQKRMTGAVWRDKHGLTLSKEGIIFSSQDSMREWLVRIWQTVELWGQYIFPGTNWEDIHKTKFSRYLEILCEQWQFCRLQNQGQSTRPHQDRQLGEKLLEYIRLCHIDWKPGFCNSRRSGTKDKNKSKSTAK